MDKVIQQQIDRLITELENSNRIMNDPVSKLMVTTLVYQAQKIKDEIERIPERITERLSSIFVPKNKINAIPAVCLVQPSVKARRDITPHIITDGTFFSYKINARQSLNYYPLFKNRIIPYTRLYMLTPRWLRSDKGYTEIQLGKKGQVWIGLEVTSEIDTFQYVSFLVKNTGGILPKSISVCNEAVDLTFSDASQFDELPMAELFDSQQMDAELIETISIWRHCINGGDSNRLAYVTDSLTDRDAFKCKAYPKVFQHYLESNDLDQFDNNILWILFDFGNEYEVPDNIEIIPNIVPVVNINVNNVTLTQSSPIAKLTKNDGSYFLSVVKTPLAAQHQGFSVNDEEFVIRDFDVSCYNPENLYKDIRNLYNHFIDDYHAFIDYHDLKDGESIRSLREMVNRIGKSVEHNRDMKNRYDEGTYAMRNINLSSQSSPVKITYLTTFGKLGNTPRAKEIMENKKDAALAKEVNVVTSADCGEDKASADQMYEMLRYHTLTADRLFTKMDIDAFVRIKLLKEFGNEEVKRISHNISIGGATSETKLCRGLYVDISFKDLKNYKEAVSMSFDAKLKQMIVDKSCISMPIIVTLKSLEQ